jgi:hypothetical protein
MYLRSISESMDALANVLRLADPREQLIQSTVQIMLCLDPEPRCLLVDAQSFLIHDGLATLRIRRRRILDSLGEPLPISAWGPDGRAILESVAASMDALRFAELVRAVLPGLREERWRIARAILVNEGGVRSLVQRALTSRRDPVHQGEAENALREMILSLHQAWMDRAGAIRTTCLDALKSLSPMDPEDLHPEADLLFELIATSDARALALLEAVDRDPVSAFAQVSGLEDIALALRAVGADVPPDPGGGNGFREVA